jgi:hypothetical protein
MKVRHRYLIARAFAFAGLLITAGAMATSIAEQQPVASLDLDIDSKRSDFVAMRSEQR